MALNYINLHQKRSEGFGVRVCVCACACVCACVCVHVDLQNTTQPTHKSCNYDLG